MKYFLSLFIATVVLSACKTTENQIQELKNEPWNTNIMLKPGSNFNHPTYAIWLETSTGEFIKTLFVTQSFATGIFKHGMSSDSTWSSNSGISEQPAALPYFLHRYRKDHPMVPTPAKPLTDAYTGATPTGLSSIKVQTPSSDLPLRIFLEVNQTGDWNSFWHNNKMPNNRYYKRSAQPSVIYSVLLNSEDSVFYLNPIGHGSPDGSDGKLYTDLSGLTGALKIFESIQIQIQ